MLKLVRVAATLAFAVAAGTCTAVSQTDRNSAVYAALFKGEYPSFKPLSELLVQDTTIPMPTLTGSNSDWLRAFEKLPNGLRLAASQPIPTRASALDARLFPAGTRFVSERAIQAMFEGHGVEENWASFRRQYGAEGWVAFSDVLLAGDGKEALVYYERRCGGLCGDGGYVWLHRDSPQSPWAIRERISSWVS